MILEFTKREVLSQFLNFQVRGYNGHKAIVHPDGETLEVFYDNVHSKKFKVSEVISQFEYAYRKVGQEVRVI